MDGLEEERQLRHAGEDGRSSRDSSTSMRATLLAGGEVEVQKAALSPAHHVGDRFSGRGEELGECGSTPTGMGATFSSPAGASSTREGGRARGGTGWPGRGVAEGSGARDSMSGGFGAGVAVGAEVKAASCSFLAAMMMFRVFCMILAMRRFLPRFTPVRHFFASVILRMDERNTASSASGVMSSCSVRSSASRKAGENMIRL